MVGRNVLGTLGWLDFRVGNGLDEPTSDARARGRDGAAGACGVVTPALTVTGVSAVGAAAQSAHNSTPNSINNGGIFQAPLGVKVAVSGFYEIFGGCYDGDPGQWTVSPQPGYGVTSTAIVTDNTQAGC